MDYWVLVAEGDNELRENVLVPGLQQYGFEKVVGAESALAALLAMSARTFAVVVMDIGLPGESGTSFARHVRTATDARIVVLADRYGSRLDLALCMDSDVDAYMAKPVDVELLAASLRSLIRRHFPATSPDQPPRDWQFDLDGWVLQSPSGVRVQLTHGERTLLRPLFEFRTHVVPRSVLIAELARTASGNVVAEHFDPHRLELMVHRLRQKIGRVVTEPFPLVAVRGAGYALTR